MFVGSVFYAEGNL